jgi:hypothetical protein
LDEKGKVFEYEMTQEDNKLHEGEFFAKTSESDFDEYLLQTPPVEQTKMMLMENIKAKEQDMQNTGNFSDFAVPGINNASEVNPSANPASSFDFDQSKCTKKSEKNIELSLEDLGD